MSEYFLAATPGSEKKPSPLPPLPFNARRSSVYGRSHMVSSSQTLASTVGHNLLMKGANFKYINLFNNKDLQMDAGRNKTERAHEHASKWPTNLEGHVPDKRAPIQIT